MDSERAFHGVLALLFVSSAAWTIAQCSSMSAMAGMPMPGGWTMSMAWMPMDGGTWFDTTTSFLGMWIVMMVAMMLPSLVPMLTRYRQSVRAVGGPQEPRIAFLTVVVSTGYFVVWTVCGVLVFAAGVALTTLEMRVPLLAQTVPIVIGATLLLAGALQFSDWKVRCLRRCRETGPRDLPALAGVAWRYGIRLGVFCSFSCLGPMAVLLALGVMDVRAMAIVIIAIALERLAPAGDRFARVSGGFAVVAGLLVLVQVAAGG